MTPAFDTKRALVLEAAGFRVLRIWCSDLFKVRESVLDAIWRALHDERVFSPLWEKTAGAQRRQMRGDSATLPCMRNHPSPKSRQVSPPAPAIPLPQGERGSVACATPAE
jgi:hypothetical protein